MHFASLVSDTDSSSSDSEFTVVTIGGKTRVLTAGEKLHLPGLSGLQIGSGHIHTVESRGKSRHFHHRPSSSSGSSQVGESSKSYRENTRKNKPLSDSDDPPSRSDLNHVSNNIGKHWKKLASWLGLSRGQIETIESDNRVEGHYEMAYQTLLKWKRRNGGFVTVRDLVMALDSIGARTTIAADKLYDDTASYGTGGLFIPAFSQGLAKNDVQFLKKWITTSWKFYCNLASSSEARESGVTFISGYDLIDELSSEEDLLYKDVVLNCVEMSDGEKQTLGFQNFKHVFKVTTVVIYMVKYLKWLRKRFEENGGKIVRRHVSSFDEVSWIFTRCLIKVKLSAKMNMP